MNHPASESPAAVSSPENAPLAHPLRQKIQDGLVALSLANLWFIGAWYTTMRVSPVLEYARKVPLTEAKLLALTVNMFWFTAVVWLIMQAMRRSRSRWFRPVCEWLFLLSLLIPLDTCRQIVFGTTAVQVITFLKRPLGVLLLLLLVVGVACKRRWIVRAAAIAVGILSPLALMTLGRMALASLNPQHVSEPALPPMSRVREGQPRVVWMIFDETDQRVAFEQRPPRVGMPEFDRFLRESLSATNAYPPGNNTIESIPGLTTGLRVSEAFPTNSSQLILKLTDSGRTVSWSELPSVFDSARDLGFNTALVGWYHPYPRVLGRSLNYCSWYPIMFIQPVPALTFGGAMRDELECVAWYLHLRHLYVNICRATLADSLSLVTNASYGLIFLHLPPPHRPWVFDPATGRFTLLDMSKAAGYFNNLALADRTFGKLRAAMEASNQWNRSWIIVSADHSWRASAEYDGRRDFRVPFLVKAPGPNQPVVYSPAINTLLTHDLILAILRSELTNQQQVVPWLDSHPTVRAPPPPTLNDD